MPRVELLLAAESHAVDQQTNALSIFNIIEGTYTGIIPKVVFITVWKREPGDEDRDFQSLLRVTSGARQVGEFPLNFRMTAPRHRSFHVLMGLPAGRAGETIRFEVLLNGQSVGRCEIEVSEAPA